MRADGAISGTAVRVDTSGTSPSSGRSGTSASRQSHIDAPPKYRHLVLIDGDCGLCQAAMAFVARVDPQRVFGFAPLTGEVAARVLGNRRDVQDGPGTMYVATDRNTPQERLLARSDAVIFVAGRLQWPWRAAGILRWLPKRMRDGCYDLLAANRHRFAAAGGTCGLPAPSGWDRIVVR